MVLLRFENNEWIEVSKEDKVETDVYLDRFLVKALDHYKSQQKKDNDIVLILEGDEGSGKSTLMGNILEYMSNGNFNPQTDLIGSDYLDGLEKIEKAKKRGWLGFDEGNTFFLATETMKRQHRDLHKLFSIFRQKNLFVIICLPSFFRLGTYFAQDRSAGLVRTYIKKGKRGYFSYFGKKGKDNLYRKGRPTYNAHAVSPQIRGRFAKCFKLENEAYKSFKMQTLTNEIAKAKETVKKPKTEYDMKLEFNRNLIEKNMDKTSRELSELFGMTIRRVQQIKKVIREDISLQ